MEHELAIHIFVGDHGGSRYVCKYYSAADGVLALELLGEDLQMYLDRLNPPAKPFARMIRDEGAVRVPLSESVIRARVREIALGLGDLHRMGVKHGDLKLSNVKSSPIHRGSIQN